MRFLIDNALSPVVAALLRSAGHDALHVHALGLASAADDLVLAAARRTRRVLVSADTDFGFLLAQSGVTRPSVIVFRGPSQRQPAAQAALLLANLPGLNPSLMGGCLAVFDEHRVRIRPLPIAAGRTTAPRRSSPPSAGTSPSGQAPAPPEAAPRGTKAT